MSETLRCALVGHPIEHSLSPVMHLAAYEILGLDWEYTAVDVPAGGFFDFVASVDDSWRGLSVTMPHKAAACALGEPDELCRKVGVGNTVLFEADGAHVYNTDVSGFVAAITEAELTEVWQARVLGAGGTARAALVALDMLGCRYVNLCVRTPAKAMPLIELAKDLGLEVALDQIGTPVAPADLTISTLPARVCDEFADWVISDVDAVFDVSYDPWPTKLASAGEAAGLVVLNGIDLLAAQGAEQVALMTGKNVESAVLKEAALAELARRGSSGSHL